MEDRLVIIETRLAGLEKVKEEFFEIKNSIVKMEMVDKNIFDKLEAINKTMSIHKENFVQHDKNEMNKYDIIDKRLVKIERIIYICIGAILAFQFLSKMNFIKIAG